MLRSLLVLVVLLVGRVAAAQPPQRSTVFRLDSARSKRATASGTNTSLVDTVTATLGRMEAHVTTVAPGQEPHAPHSHPDEELIVVVQGTLDVLQEGVVRRARAGDVIFQAANERHGLRNVGADTARYYVIRPDPRPKAP